MKLIVNAHNIELIKEETVNEKEINISKCTFEFSDEYGDNLVKEAYFTLEGETYKQIIVNNECSYPPEVLAKTGTVELGVVAYEIAGSEYIERYNPSPVYFQTVIGSLKDHAENSQEITPSEMEQFEQALEEGLAEVANVDIDAVKVDNTATVSITNRNGETKTVEIYDGEKGEDGEPGITPNIQVGNTTTLPAGSNATVTQRGTTENPIFDFGIPKGEDGQGGGSSDYTELENKPKINNVELNGNKTTSDLGINIPDVSDFITKDVDNLTNYYKKTETYNKTEIDNKVSSVYRYRGTVQTYNDLPSTDLVIGDVYNIEQADSQHGIEAGDNVAWTGTTWDKLSGNVDLSGYQPLLVSGTNIKTVNGTSVLGSGDVSNTYVIPKTYNTTAVINMVDDLYQRYKNGEALNIYGVVPVSNYDVTLPLNFSNFSTTTSLVSCYYLSDVNAGNKSLGYYAYYQLSKTNDHITSVLRFMKEVNVSAGSGFILKTDNIASYTPTADSYNPATAKYAEAKALDVKTQYSTMPTANADNLGKIVQFIGTTDITYTNGYFYKCVSDGNNPATYSWENISIQEAVSSKYYVDGDYLIYRLTPNSNVILTTENTTNTNCYLNQTDLSTALTLAKTLGKSKVFLKISTTSYTKSANNGLETTIYISNISSNMSGDYYAINSSGNQFQMYYEFSASINGNNVNVTSTKIKNYRLQSIGVNNTIAYTPSNDYNPATKKYVDDLITANGKPKYYIDGSYVIYNVSPGNYNFTSANQTTWTTITNISTTELSEALTLAYQNDKYLVLNIPTTATAQTITFIASSKVAYGIGMGLILSGTMVTSSGNVASVNINITYESTQTTATVSQAKAKMMTLYALGTTNTTSFTPTAVTHPATKGYVDDAITSAITTTLNGNY